MVNLALFGILFYLIKIFLGTWSTLFQAHLGVKRYPSDLDHDTRPAGNLPSLSIPLDEGDPSTAHRVSFLTPPATGKCDSLMSSQLRAHLHARQDRFDVWIPT